MNYYEKIIEEKKNAKEKKNGTFDEVRKFTYKECLVTILQLNTGMFSGRYTFSITKDGREELSKDVSTSQQEAERKAKREVETVWNEKENSTVATGNLTYGRYEIKKEKEPFSTKGFAYIGYVYSKDGSVTKTAPCESIEQCEKDILGHKTFKAYASNSKEKENGYDIVERGTMKGYEYFIEEISTPNKSSFRANLKKDGKVIITTHTWETKEKAKQQLKELADKDPYINNSKEKTNSTVIRGTIHGHKYEVDRMSDGTYMGYVYDEEDYPIYKTSLYSSAAEAEKEIKSKIFNSKEEKGYYAQIIERKNANLFDIALALIGKKVPVQEAVRELTDTYGLSKHEAYKLLEKAATHLEQARRAKVLHENK